MTVNFKINRNKLSKPEKSILVVIYHEGKQFSMTTGLKALIDNWDGKKQQFKRSHPHFEIANRLLNQIKTKIEKILINMQLEHENLTFQQVKNIVYKEYRGIDYKDFFTVYNSFVAVKSSNVSKSTYTKYNTIGNHLKEFEQSNDKIEFENIDLNFFDNLVNWYYENDYSDNYIRKCLQFFKVFLRWSLEREYHRNTKFQKYELPANFETTKVALSNTELLQIENLTDLTFPEMKARDIFLFQCYTGQRFSDVANVNIKDTKNGIWKVRQLKTQKTIEMQLPPKALKILQRNNGKLPKLSNPQTNKLIKIIGKKAGITEKIEVTRKSGNEIVTKQYPKYALITTHTARRTFITIGLTKGITPQVIKSYTGHIEDGILDTYYKKDLIQNATAINKIFEG